VRECHRRPSRPSPATVPATRPFSPGRVEAAFPRSDAARDDDTAVIALRNDPTISAVIPPSPPLSHDLRRDLTISAAISESPSHDPRAGPCAATEPALRQK
jgi:hypothetical protein